MTFPNLPTDNLYKFLALSGVVLCIACLTLSAITAQDFSSKRVEVLTDLAEIQQDLNSINANNADIPAAMKAISIINDRTRIKQAEITDMNAIYATTSENLKLGIQTGFISSIVGFVLWYVKVQRHEDKILRSQVPVSPKKDKKKYTSLKRLKSSTPNIKSRK